MSAEPTKASYYVDINQSLLTTSSTDIFFRFLPLKIGVGETEGSGGVGTSCGLLTSSDGSLCLGLETVVPMECHEIPLGLRLCIPFVLPLTFEGTERFAKVIKKISTTRSIGAKNRYLL